MRPELVQATELLRSRDPQSIEQALLLLQDTVFSFSMKVCGHREDAEDTMQDVLLKSLPYLAKLENPKALAVWLYKVTRNRCWMSRRRSKFAPKQMLALDDLIPTSSELESLATHPDKSPEHNAIAQQESEKVQQAILRIPANYRLILVLHDMEDLDTSEVANVTGLREGTVRVRLHRARLFVRRELTLDGNSKVHKSTSTKKSARPTKCREMFASLSEYIDGRSDNLSCEHIQKHLQTCPPCMAFISDLEKAIDRCRTYKVPCKSETTDKIRALLVKEYLRILESVPNRNQVN